MSAPDFTAARLRFLGAAGTVTGSRYLLEAAGASVLVDCGLYQGLKPLRLRNWQPWPTDLAKLSAVVLTHAHVDHSGYLPRLYRLGYRGPIHCTHGTRALLEILLPDAARLQEEEAEFANRHGYSKHHPAEPLFTTTDAEGVLGLLSPADYRTEIQLQTRIGLNYWPAGHLLGAASAAITIRTGSQQRRVVFSGDIGRYEDDFMAAPQPPRGAVDYLLIESTYGDRAHPTHAVDEQLARVVTESIGRGGVLLVPAFAVGRTQEMLFRLARIERAGLIPKLDVYVDSPMAIDATHIYRSFAGDLNFDWSRAPTGLATARSRFVRAVADSKALHDVSSRAVIISASGMATGGRVLHHLLRRLPDPRNTVLFAGYQVEGTRGRKIVDGARTIRMLGVDVDVRAHVENLRGFSAHGDRDDLLRWARSLEGIPRGTFVVHGEPLAARALRDRLETECGHRSVVAQLDDVVALV